MILRERKRDYPITELPIFSVLERVCYREEAVRVLAVSFLWFLSWANFENVNGFPITLNAPRGG